MRRLTILGITCGLLAAMPAAAQVASSDTAENEITATVKSYVDAFNRRDAKALAAHWSPQAVYTSRTTGDQVVGREAIAKEFAAIFEAAKETRLGVRVDSIQLISPNVAVEYGKARLFEPEQPATESEYTAVYMKIDGKWLLDRVTEEEVPVVQSHYEQLKALEWMIGKWVDADDNATIKTECQWTRNRNYITRYFTVAIQDHVDMAGMQIVGWDPAAKRIRSWVFDSDGGFGEGTWTKKGDRWFIQKTAVMADGRKGSSVNIVKRLDDDTFTLQSVSRSVDGEILPNIEEVRVVRAPNE